MLLITFAAAAAFSHTRTDDRVARAVDCRPALMRAALDGSQCLAVKRDARTRMQRRCVILASA